MRARKEKCFSCFDTSFFVSSEYGFLCFVFFLFVLFVFVFVFVFVFLFFFWFFWFFFFFCFVLLCFCLLVCFFLFCFFCSPNNKKKNSTFFSFHGSFSVPCLRSFPFVVTLSFLRFRARREKERKV